MWNSKIINFLKYVFCPWPITNVFANIFQQHAGVQKLTLEGAAARTKTTNLNQYHLPLTIKLQTKEIPSIFLCFLSASTGQVRYILIPVFPINAFPAEILMEHVPIVHYVGRKWSLGSMQVLEAAYLLKLESTRRFNWNKEKKSTCKLKVPCLSNFKGKIKWK